MCGDVNVVRKNFFGELCYCEFHNLFHLSFANILIELTHRELMAFHLVVKEIDIEYWSNLCINKKHKRKYPIKTSQQNLVLIFDLNELYALRELVLIGSSNCKESISPLDFGLPISLN